MDLSGGEQEDVVQRSFPDNLNQTPESCLAEPEPIPEDTSDHVFGEELLRYAGPLIRSETRPHSREHPTTP